MENFKGKKDLELEAYNKACNTVRAERDLLLKETDFYALTDTVEAPESVLTYRKALRDITLQEGFPFEVEWPQL